MTSPPPPPPNKSKSWLPLAAGAGALGAAAWGVYLFYTPQSSSGPNSPISTMMMKVAGDSAVANINENHGKVVGFLLKFKRLLDWKASIFLLGTPTSVYSIARRYEENRARLAALPSGETALHAAVRQGDIAEVRELVRPQSLLWTCWRAIRGLPTEVSIASRARSRHRNDGDTALALAVRFGQRDIVGELISQGAPLGDAFLLACRKGHTDVVETLLPYANLPGSDAGCVAMAVIAGKLELVLLLIEAGADVNAVTGEASTTALYEAVRADRADIVRLLLEKGAQPNVPTRGKWTPLHLAYKCKTDWHLVQLLLDAGADDTLKNSDNKVPSALPCRRCRKRAPHNENQPEPV